MKQGLRSRWTGALAASLVAVGLSVLPGTASAALVHPFLGSFQAGPGAAQDLALDAEGNVYVLYREAREIRKFSPAGAPVDFSAFGSNVLNGKSGPSQVPTEGFSFEGNSGAAVAVDNSASPASGEIYITNNASRTINVFSHAGAYIGDLPFENRGEPLGVDINSKGEVVVSLWGERQLLRYLPVSADPTQDTLTGTVHELEFSPGVNAIDSTGTVYAAGWAGGPLYAFEPDQFLSGAKAVPSPFAPAPLSNAVTAATVDQVNDDLFFISPEPESQVFQYKKGTVGEAAHQFGEPFGGGALTSEARGLAVDHAANTIYVSEGGPSEKSTKILKYQLTQVILPDVTTDPTPTPTIGALSATLEGNVDPAGGPGVTKCQLEWGPGAGYKSTPVPCTPAASVGTPYTSPTDVSAEITGLVSGVTYHYRFSATNENGTTFGEDQSFKAPSPPDITGVTVRELTETSALLLAKVNPNGFDTTYRFEYGLTPDYTDQIPIPAEDIGAGASAVELAKRITGLTAATYHFRIVATNEFGTTASDDQTFTYFPPACPNRVVRQQTGGSYLPDCRAYELVSPESAGNVIFFPNAGPFTAHASQPPRFSFGGALGGLTGTEPTNSISIDIYVSTRSASGWTTHYVGVPGSQTLGASNLFADRTYSKFWDWKQEGGFAGVEQPPDAAPYVWDSEGHLLERWPVDHETIPDFDTISGAFQTSPDFSHLAISSNNVELAPGGQTGLLGSAYDYDTETHELKLISTLPGGEPIPQQPGMAGNTEDTILFPVPGIMPGPDGDGKIQPTLRENSAVSLDGSHILMATQKEPRCQFNCVPPELRLYMSVDDQPALKVSRDANVHLIGMTPDGEHVLYTTAAKLDPADTDNSDDLYRWNAADDSIDLLTHSNDDACEASWIERCGVLPVEGATFQDNSMADNGDVYFYSPEILESGRGEFNGHNLYVARGDQIQYVTTVESERDCGPQKEEGCGNGPLVRIQVSPEDDHAAFVTASAFPGYDNANTQQVYSYEPLTRRLHCVSCRPDGKPPVGDAAASINGRFMSDNGRTFFYTPDDLAQPDTNELRDVYEYVDGRPQLITAGTGSEDTQTTPNQERPAGLMNVSADGVDVYFATYDTLVPSDRNGQFMKFYDARVNGGFPIDQVPAPCEAADECHGPGTSAPVHAPAVSEGDFGNGGNAKKGKAKKKHAKKHKKHKKKKSTKRSARGDKGRTHG